MVRYFFIFILLFLYVKSLSQNNIPSTDTVRLKHENYTTIFSKSKKYPIIVEWWVTKAKVNCEDPLKRKDDFEPDPLLPKETDLAKEYVNSGYDRGHMCPAADNLCQTELIQKESFYFSNMAPQIHSLNAGDWKSLEVYTRQESVKYDSVRVWCGNIGEIKKIGSVSVPKKCWKIIYIKKLNQWHYFIFDNIAQKQDGFENNKIDKDTFIKTTGLNYVFK